MISTSALLRTRQFLFEFHTVDTVPVLRQAFLSVFPDPVEEYIGRSVTREFLRDDTEQSFRFVPFLDAEMFQAFPVIVKTFPLSFGKIFFETGQFIQRDNIVLALTRTLSSCLVMNSV